MINILKVGRFVIFALMVSACSSSPDVTTQTNENQIVADKKAVASIEQDLAEWKEMKPSLERLVMIESDLKELIIEMANMASEQQKTIEAEPQPASTVKITPAPTPEPITPDPIIAAKSKPEPIVESIAAPSYSNYALQVYTINNKEVLDKSWLRWSKNYTATLMKHSRIYQETKKDGISYYRIKISDFTTKQDALDTCQELKKQGGDCFLTNNLGHNF